MKHIRNNFLTGLFVSLPIVVTLWILTWIFNRLDSIIGNTITNILGYRIPGLGLILVVAFIFIVGSVASNVIGKRITKFLELKFQQIPIIKTIYSPLRDILKNIANRKSNDFKKAVFVNFPLMGSLSIGFITKENVIVNGEERTVIFVPTTPNPTSGFLVYLKKGDYQELDIPVDVALKSIISLGSVSPDIIGRKKDQT
jgi:uncharacterized membrane protein